MHIDLHVSFHVKNLAILATVQGTCTFSHYGYQGFIQLRLFITQILSLSVERKSRPVVIIRGQISLIPGKKHIPMIWEYQRSPVKSAKAFD